MLSVITPVYNGGRFIEGCINNIIEQKCPDVEHIIIDAVSTDNTMEVVKHYAERCKHIRWVSEKDKGQSDAMNKGIRMARGKIIGFLNVDDFYEPNVFNRVLKIFQSLPEPSFVTANCNQWNDDNKITTVCKPKKLKLADLLLGFGVNPHPVNPSAYFYHKSLHQAVGFYDVNIDIAMDQEFIFRAVQKAHVKYIDELWGNFRMIKGTKTYNDMRSNKIFERNSNILKSYRRYLPWSQRWLVAAKYNFFNVICPKSKRLIYYLGSPGEIASMLQRKQKKE